MRQLSKGMVTQLHLALILAIDAKLLVLDEPTLGLDLLFRRSFYDNLLNDYFNHERTILVTTHQVEEIENILTDVMFIERGSIALDSSMESLGERFTQLVPVSGQRREGACAQAVLRTRSLRPRGDVVRRPQGSRARIAGRDPHAVGRRPVRRDDGPEGRPTGRIAKEAA